jgi:putative transposase
VVFCPKYRKPVLNPPIDAKLKKLIQQVCDETQSALIEMEVMHGVGKGALAPCPPFSSR